MSFQPSDISVVIPSYRRGKVLRDTLRLLLDLPVKPGEILVVDQTAEHPPEVLQEFQVLESAGRIRRIILSRPSIPHAMNAGLRAAKGAIVLFLDDDIIPAPDLVEAHRRAYEQHPDARAVVGQVLQPEDGGQGSGGGRQKKVDRTRKKEDRCRKSEEDGLRKDLDFKFNRDSPDWVENVMAGNLSVNREMALAVGGFDEKFIPPVSFRFETEFARRLIAVGGKIWFAPKASIQHLRVSTGGTRSRGSHLTSASPLHGAGDYYYALRCGKGLDRALYMLRRPFREVCTRFHLLHPWWITVKFVGELRAMALAFRLNHAGAVSIPHAKDSRIMEPATKPWKLVAVETHPIQYKAPLFRCLANDPRFEFTVLYAMVPDAAQQGAGFGVPFSWDVPLLEGYCYEMLENRAETPSVIRFGGCDTPGIHAWLRHHRPDAVLVNGWVVKTCLQTLVACRRLKIPCIVRGEANLLRPRAWWKHVLHRLLVHQYSAWLAIGSASRAFYRSLGCREDRICWAPYAVDNERFAALAVERRPRRDELRAAFGIHRAATVFLFAGKLEDKKHPLDLLKAVSLLPPAQRSTMHVLVAGDGPQMADCRALAARIGTPVTFAGFLNQSRMPDAYAAADVLVLPSDAGETWGLVVNEAMASGRPAIVSRSAGCCADLIVEGETGFSFDVRDVEALAGHLRRYMMEPGLAERQGDHASAHIAGFDFRSVAEGVYTAVRSCRNPKSGDARSRAC